MADTEPGTERRAPRWMKVLLILSLAANLLVIGIVGGAAYRFGKMDDRGGGPRQGVAFVAALDKEDRRPFLRDMRGAQREARGKGRAEMEAILTALRAESFDAEAFRALMQNQMDRAHDVQGRVGDALTEKLSAMSLEERQTYADRLQRRLEGGGRDKHKKWRD